MIVEMQCSVPMADYYAIGKTSVRWALGYYSTSGGHWELLLATSGGH